MTFLTNKNIDRICKEYLHHRKLFKVMNKGHDEYRHYGIKNNQELYLYIEDVLYLLRVDPWQIPKNTTYFRLLFHIRSNGYNIMRKYEQFDKIKKNNEKECTVESQTDIFYISELTQKTFSAFVNYNCNDVKHFFHDQNKEKLLLENTDNETVNKKNKLLFENISFASKQYQKIIDDAIDTSSSNTNNFFDNFDPDYTPNKVNLIDCYNYVHAFHEIIDSCISEIHHNFYIHKRHKNFVRTEEPHDELLIVKKHDIFMFKEVDKIHCILGDDIFAMLKIKRVNKLSLENSPESFKEHNKVNFRSRKW